LNLPDKIEKVESGPNYSLGLTNDGKVYAWGNNNFGQLGTGSLRSLNEPYLLDALYG
jgi:alpha-tubulin suppressor-like RCC1 family protein